MSHCRVLGQVILFTIFVNEIFSSNSVYELRKKYLNGDYSVKNVLETSEFDFPENVLSQLTLFEIYYDQKNYQKMEEIYQNICNYYPINQLLEYKLGTFYYKSQDYQKTKEHFSKCIKKDSRFFEARKLLAKSCVLTKDYKEAYKHYNVISWFDTKDKEIQKELYKLSSYINNKQPLYNKNFSQNFVRISSSNEIDSNLLPDIDIGISTKDNGNILNIDTVKLKCSDTFYILNDKNNVVLTSPNIFDKKTEKIISYSWKIIYRKKINSIAIISPFLQKEYRIKSSYIILKSSNPNATFLIEEYATFKYKLPQYKEYNGDIILKTYKNNLVVINRTKLDYYLYGVIPKEIGKDKPLEAIKTQAVVARTLALYRKKHKIHKLFDVCSGQHCQVYDGIRSEIDTVNEAINSTLGEIIVYKSTNPIHAFFHANCGGYTQNLSNIGWGKTNYIQNVSDIIGTNNYEVNKNLYNWFLFPPKLYCEESEYVHSGKSRWLRVIKKSDLSKILNNHLNIGELKNIEILSRSNSGYVTKIKLFGKKQNIVISKESVIRKIFFAEGLRSTAFLLEYNKNIDSYYFWGAGWGHGIGMCQDGSCGLAQRGENYISIIKHYYPETDVLKIY